MAYSVRTSVQAYVRGKEMNCAKDVQEALDKKITGIIDGGIARAKENKRKTLQGKDL